MKYSKVIIVDRKKIKAKIHFIVDEKMVDMPRSTIRQTKITQNLAINEG